MPRKPKIERLSKDFDRDYLWSIISNKKIPVLTLDSRWNTLFADVKDVPEIKELVKELNQLLKEQGGTVNKVKDMKKLKKKLMFNIVDNMGETADTDEKHLRGRKQEANHKLINDINVQLTESEERIMELPYEIKRVNQELLFESMIVCYGMINNNAGRVNDMTEWIENTKAELKAKIAEKEEIEKENNSLYSFMHDMVGGGVIDAFDRHLGNDDYES